jgi:hypothetical protein
MKGLPHRFRDDQRPSMIKDLLTHLSAFALKPGLFFQFRNLGGFAPLRWDLGFLQGTHHKNQTARLNFTR